MSRIVKVLHIDDDPDTRLLLRELIREGQQPDDPVQIEWLEAGDVDDAETRWAGVGVTAVFVDNRLGGREGVEFVARLKGRWGAPVWLLTGTADPRLRERAVRNGAEGVLGKDEILADGRRFRETVLRVIGASPSCR